MVLAPRVHYDTVGAIMEGASGVREGGRTTPVALCHSLVNFFLCENLNHVTSHKSSRHQRAET
jgi:hypothetical protein